MSPNPTDEVMPSINFTSPKAVQIEQHLEEISQCAQPGGNRMVTKSLLIASLARLLEATESPPVEKYVVHHKVKQCRKIIRNHLGDPSLTVARLSHLTECSRNYLSHLFHRTTGTRLSEYINQQRIAYACDLLDRTSFNVAETAIACGFRGQGYFTRVFRSVTGRTPREYRRRPNSPD